MKSILSVVLLIAISMSAHAQRYRSVVFEKLPQSYQLFPRDSQNEALVPVAGIVEGAGWNYMSVLVSRNGASYKYLKSALKYTGTVGSFAMETKIKAELAGYDFKVYVCRAADSVLVVDVKDVVSGDVYVVSGQSNSTGFFAETDTSRFCRTFGKITGNLNTDIYNAADTLWAYSNMNGYENSVGTMGLEIQKQLSQASGIPNCLINAGFHWSSAFSHAIRSENNPADLNTGYGRMLYRLQKGKLSNSVKAYIFRQGETEAYHEGFNWPENFAKLRDNLKKDLPGLSKFYVFQIDIIYYPSHVGAELRDYQRRLPQIYPDVVSLATVGTKQFDGLHYGSEGNAQGGMEVSRLIARDFYNTTDTTGIESPSVQKVFYASDERKQLILVFDEGQEIIYPQPYKPNNNVTLDLKDFFFLDFGAGSVKEGRAEGNRVILDLNSPQNASTIYYLPMFLEQGGPYYPFNGPFLTNRRGMRAFTFFNVGIGKGLATPTLTAEAKPEGGIQLKWNEIEGAEGFVVERKRPAETAFSVIGRPTAQTTQLNDSPVESVGKIAYRIKAVNKTVESGGYGTAETEATVILSAGPEDDQMFSVFPNPVAQGKPVTVRFNGKSAGHIAVINAAGQQVLGENITQQQEVILDISQKPAATYILQLKSGDQVKTKKLWIR